MKHKKIFKKRKLKIYIALICFTNILILIYLFFNNVVNPVIIEISQSKVRSMAQKAVSSAIYEVIKDSAIYDTLVTITRDNNGDISLISSNSLQINLLTRELSKKAQTNLEVVCEHGIDIPIGTFTGMPILVGRGPNIGIKLLPIGAISSNFVTEFESAGINQTNHKIYLNVQSNVSVILPTAIKTVSTVTQMLLCESIIIGKIPETYLNCNQMDNLLDLIP